MNDARVNGLGENARQKYEALVAASAAGERERAMQALSAWQSAHQEWLAAAGMLPVVGPGVITQPRRGW